MILVIKWTWAAVGYVSNNLCLLGGSHTAQIYLEAEGLSLWSHLSSQDNYYGYTGNFYCAWPVRLKWPVDIHNRLIGLQDT